MRQIAALVMATPLAGPRERRPRATAGPLHCATQRGDHMRCFAIVVSLPLVLHAFDARAQFGGLLDRAKERAERTAIDSAEKAARGATQPARDAKPPTPEKGARSDSAAPAGARGRGGDDAGGEPASVPAGEVYGNRFDFVPGDKVLVHDDFSDTDVGEYPAKWTIKGGGGNQIEVVEIGGRRLVKARYQKRSQQDAIEWLRYEIKGDLPRKFTIEFDADLAGPFAVLFSERYGFGGQRIAFRPRDDNQVTSQNAAGQLSVKKGLAHVAIAVSGTQAKVYVAGERVLADPDAVVRPIKRIGFHFLQPYREEGDHQMFTAFRLAEGGKDAKAMLAGEGKIVTHGILFDTGSDVIRPESGPTLRTIHALLTEEPSLRFSIDGHTDNQGSAKVNQPLSERRAGAVKTWLVKQGIDEKRLAAKGFGDTKPIDTNVTAEGRANNRRVEFVRL